MTNTKILKQLVLGATLGAVSLVAMQADPACAVSFNFSVSNPGGEWGTGSLIGFDNNSDGLLTQAELDSFYFSPSGDDTVTLGDLFSFGSFNLDTGVWNADGEGWDESGIAYFSWSGGGLSVNSYWATISHDYAVGEPTPVPEPASTFGLLALGTLGVGSMLKRKQQRKAAA